MKYFSFLLVFIFVSSCNRVDTNETIYFKVKNPKDYTTHDYYYEERIHKNQPLNSKSVFLVMDSPDDLSVFTFYDSNYNLMQRGKIEYYWDDKHFSACIQNGKIHGFSRIFEKEDETIFNSPVIKEVQIRNNTDYVALHAENLQLTAEYCYHHGIKHGPYREFKNGHLTKSGRYYFGHKIGAEKEYSTSGVLRRIVQYQDGHEVSEKKYFEYGQLSSLVLYGNSFQWYDDIPIHRETYNYSGLLVEEFNRSGVSKIYNYDSKNYSTYKIDAEGHFKGSYYCTFDEYGNFKYAIDMSKFKKGILLLKLSNLNMQCKLASGELVDVIYEQNDSDVKYLYDNKRTYVKKLRANKLVGIYFPETKVIRGKIDPTQIDLHEIVFSDDDKARIQELSRDLEKGQADIDDFENLLKCLYEGR